MTGVQLSGRNYVSARLKPDSMNDGEKPPKAGPIPIVSTQNCRHAESICHTLRCVESWQRDWELLFHRTAGGRELADSLGIPRERDASARQMDG